MKNDTICAITTSSGNGAISVIKLSGDNSINICNKILQYKNLNKIKSHTINYNKIIEEKQIIDEVLISVFKNPKSHTGENIVEISCHSSTYIEKKILQLLLNNGARLAKPGEFTLRSFLNGKIDLSQAEAVADLIASKTELSHKVAMNQMRGGFSSELKELRKQLINFASLIELELDFSEEDVEFANREKFKELLSNIKLKIKNLISSFDYGNVIKNGVPVAIVGKPNVGKSTLLNALLNEEKAIVSNIPGTTRDVIEDVVIINGISFRFIDTAGLRNTNDKIEKIGIEKAIEKAKKAKITLYLIDANEDLKEQISEIEKFKKKSNNKIIIVINKIDQKNIKDHNIQNCFYISAKSKKGLDKLQNHLSEDFQMNMNSNEVTINNIRHIEALKKALVNINDTLNGIENKISGELLSQDIRQCISNIGEITGEITTNDLLENIFSNFCIGK